MVSIPSRPGFGVPSFGGSVTYKALEAKSTLLGAAAEVVEAASKAASLQMYNEGSVGKIRYSLKVYAGGRMHSAIVMPQQPSMKTVRTTPAVDIRRTLGDLPVRHHNTNRLWDVVLGGLTGLEQRAIVNNGAIRTLYGIQALLALDKFINDYQALAAARTFTYLKNPRNYNTYTDSVYMVLVDNDEGFSYRVEIRSWEWDRDASFTRVANAKWRLHMVAYKLDTAMAGGQVELPNQEKFSVTKEQVRAAVPYETGILSIAKPVSAGSAELILQTVTNGATPPGMTSFDAWMSKAERTTGALQQRLQTCRRYVLAYRDRAIRLNNLLNQVSDLLRMPVGLLTECVVILEQLLFAYEKVFDLGDGAFADARALQGQLQEAYGRAVDAAEATFNLFADQGGTPGMLSAVRGIVLDTQPGSTAAPGSTVKEGTNFNLQSAAAYLCQEGDTWQSIALLYFGTTDGWAEIAQFNHAASSESNADAIPIQAGTVVLVPGAGDTDDQITLGQQTTDLYGTDLALEDGDLQLNARSFSYDDGSTILTDDYTPTDVGLVRGQANLVQGLVNRMRTAQGEIQYAPGYGLIAVQVGSALTAEVLSSVIVTATDQMTQDPRVQQVQQVTLKQEASRLRLDMEIQPRSGGVIPASVPLGFTG